MTSLWSLFERPDLAKHHQFLEKTRATRESETSLFWESLTLDLYRSVTSI